MECQAESTQARGGLVEQQRTEFFYEQDDKAKW